MGLRSHLLSPQQSAAANAQRLGLSSLQIHTGDSRDLSQFHGQADRVLVDAPCSGLGTLHRHADARWAAISRNHCRTGSIAARAADGSGPVRQTDGFPGLRHLYPASGRKIEEVIQAFLQSHQQWSMVPPADWTAPVDIAPPGLGQGLAPPPLHGWIFYGAVETAPVIQHLAPLPLLASTNNCDLNQRYNLPLLPMNVIAGPVANQGEPHHHPQHDRQAQGK